jgi:dipeptidyl aminopeptidase/acylaminoacyl peptidase
VTNKLRVFLQRLAGLLLFGPLMAGSGWTQSPPPRKLTLDDIDRLREVSAPEISPDGAWVAYTVSVADTAKDQADQDVWMVSWDGRTNLRLTTSKAREHTPRWSPDGRLLAFLSDREDPREVEQIWVLNRAGGEAERLTDLPGGVSEYTWSPDGKRIALVASDPDPDSATVTPDTTQRTHRPIIIDRYQFKEDETGYLDARRNHLYVFDLASRKTELLTPGAFNEQTPSWSPDGRSIAFVSKRAKEFDRTDNWDLYVIDARTGASPRQLTTFEGPDMLPDWGSRPPAWSPDGKYIAYVQGGPLKLIYYAGQKIAVIPAAGGSARVLTPSLDRNVLSPRWSADGKSILFLLEDDRVFHLARVPANGGQIDRLVQGRRTISDYSAGPGGKLAVVASTPAQPEEIFAAEGTSLRRLTTQNDAWLAQVRLAPVEEISFPSKDGTEIHGFLVKPPDYRPGKRYPTILRIHGGPVWQYYNDFANLDWQLFAANGFVVVAANPRGSSGRGEKFSTAIWADWGNKDGQDVLAAVDYAVAQGIADSSRLGVGGWSYGGILTDQVIARDHRFKAAISGAGIANVLAGYGTDQYVREYEAELGTPWGNTDAWIKVSYPFLHADRIVTPTLFLCGENDFNVPLLNSEQMYQALRSLGRETRLIIYPGEYHEIRKPSYQRDRLQRYLDWYGRHLRPDAGEAATR